MHLQGLYLGGRWGRGGGEVREIKYFLQMFLVRNLSTFNLPT